jgi:hypothetical protein
MRVCYEYIVSIPLTRSRFNELSITVRPWGTNQYNTDKSSMSAKVLDGPQADDLPRYAYERIIASRPKRDEAYQKLDEVQKMAASAGREPIKAVAGELLAVVLSRQAAADLQRLEDRRRLPTSDLVSRAISAYECLDSQLAADYELIAKDNQTGETNLIRLPEYAVVGGGLDLESTISLRCPRGITRLFVGVRNFMSALGELLGVFIKGIEK